jgi:allophanate hydrolase subunit 1
MELATQIFSPGELSRPLALMMGRQAGFSYAYPDQLTLATTHKQQHRAMGP